MNDPYDNKPASGDDDLEINYGEESSKFYVTPGQYAARSIAVNRGVSNNGNDQLEWDWVILGTGPMAGKEIRDWTALTAAAAWKIGQVVEAIGLGGAERKIKVREITEKAVGRRALITVSDNMYNGRKTSKITDYARHPEGPLPAGE